MKIDTILFDLDGTLVDSNELILKTFYLTLKSYFPRKHFSRNDLIDMVGPPLYETFAKLTNDKTIIDAMIQSYRQIYRQIEFDYVKLYPGVIESLRYFHENHFHVAIITTKFKASAAPCLANYNLNQYFDLIIGLEDVIKPKPDPEAVLMALAFFHSQNAVMVGDNTSDLIAGQKAGILTCGVNWSYKRDLLLKTNPTFWINAFSELVPTIQNYNMEA
ncbi:MAG: HAD-IA family hydrolase [Candidatus Izemoplasmatales bacterium]|nr:HAD-IA family hydrolase [Candidatus Izemoplasmatales bacterium]MDD3865495.1 HAD-IA family hydrolase [Candidatus Izemoplasmatales bacterium]